MKFFKFLLIFFLFFGGVVTHAQENNSGGLDSTGTTDNAGLDSTSDRGDGLDSTGETQEAPSTPIESVRLVNPLAGGNVNSIPQLVEGILRIVLTIGVPLVALAIIYAGFQFVMARGRPDALNKAKNTLMYVFIGAIILLGAYVIAEAIVGTVNAIRGQ